jgi:molecular chaperone GrpE
VSKKSTKTANQRESKPESEGATDYREETAERQPADTQAVDEVLEADEEIVYEPPEQQVAEEPAEKQLDALRRERDEARDRALRFQAELENYRKRVARQLDEERRYAHMPLIRDLLPVWDNMGRAIEAAEKNHEVTSLLEGFKMVTRELEDVLKRHQCAPIEALGKPFDPHLHEAILQQPSDEQPANTVLHVAQTGFQLHDRVVRPSQVIVSATVPKDEQQEQEG